MKKPGNATLQRGSQQHPARLEPGAPREKAGEYQGVVMRKGWQTKTLGETCEMYQPKTISGKEMVLDGAYPVFGANGIIGRYNQFNHEDPQLLITCRGATCGSVNISEPRSWVTGNAMVVRPKNKSLEMRYLEYLFRGGIDISKAITGAAQPQITRTNLEPLEISYPESLAEQQRIVGLLDEAFEGLATAKANAEKNLQNARALFESHLQSVFTQRGPGWIDKKLVDVCTFINGRAYKKDEMLSDGKYPLLRVGNFFTNRDWYYSDLELDADKYCDDGDLLYAWSASFGPRVWDGGKVIYHYHIWKVLPHVTVVEKRFLLHLLEWDVDEIKKAHGTGTTMMHVSKGSMESRVVPIPPLKDQAAIVLLLDDLREETQRLARLYEQKLTALEALKKSLLHQAFTGAL